MMNAKVPGISALISRNECALVLVDSRSAKGRNMEVKRDGQIVESAREARQAEPGPTVRNVLVASTSLAIAILFVVWLVFFRT
jgi:hypothetical protein